MSLHQLLIVHPVPSTRSLMTSMLRTMGHKIEEALGEESALALLDESRTDLLLVSSDLSDELDPIHLLGLVRRKYPKLPVLMFTSEPRPERAREVMLRGATSVLRFPMPANQFRAVVSQALEDVVPIRREQEKVCANGTGGVSNQNCRKRESGFDGSPAGGASAAVKGEILLGQDSVLRLAVELADAIAPTRAPVLILGERGTGKSLLSHRVHSLSHRSRGPFLEASCEPSRSPSLLVDLFGRAGAQGTGERAGLVSQARGGTLVLNEIGELSADLQNRLLELLLDGTFVPEGGEDRQFSDCRIVVTSREDLGPRLEQGLFRPDLYRAMSPVSLTLPPLRKRRGDLATLADHFRDQFARRQDKPARGFSVDAISHLVEHSWPGNVAELRDAVERAVLVSREKLITPSQLALSPASLSPVSHALDPRRQRSLSVDNRGILPLKEALEEPERQLILAALEALNWNRQETARVLDINRTTLYKKMKKYGLIFDEPVWVN